MITDPIEQWAFFFRQAMNLSPAELSDRLCDEPFAEAAGVLEMIARNPREQELYEARLKMQRDEQSRIEAAKDQSREEGREEGRLIGRIQLLQQLLRLAESPAEDLKNRPVDELEAMESDLQRQLRERELG